jgi:hypothetical protein
MLEPETEYEAWQFTSKHCGISLQIRDANER